MKNAHKNLGLPSFNTDSFKTCCLYLLGEMIAKKPGTDLIDGAPFVTGIFTLLKQFHSENTDQFLAVMGQYVRSLVEGTQR